MCVDWKCVTLRGGGLIFHKYWPLFEAVVFMRCSNGYAAARRNAAALLSTVKRGRRAEYIHHLHSFLVGSKLDSNRVMPLSHPLTLSQENWLRYFPFFLFFFCEKREKWKRMCINAYATYPGTWCHTSVVIVLLSTAPNKTRAKRGIVATSLLINPANPLEQEKLVDSNIF